MLGGAAAATPAVLQLTVGDNPVSFTGETHAYSVGFSALVAAGAASGLTILGARRADTRTVLVGTAFAVMAALLALHGFATPGVWFGANGVVAITGGATLPVGAVILALSAFPLPRGLATVRPLLVLQGLLIAAVVGLGLSALVWPSLLPPVPEPNSPAAVALLGVGLAAFALIALRALRTFLLTQRALDLAVVGGARVACKRTRSCPHDELRPARVVDRARGGARRHPARRNRGRCRPGPRCAVAPARG